MIDETLLAILRCPVTRQPLKPAEQAVLDSLKAGIQAGKVKDKAGRIITEVPTEGLLTDDENIFYPIRAGVPVLLESESIIME